MKIHRKLLCSTLLVAAPLVPVNPALAQAADASGLSGMGDGDRIADIVVTARRSAEALQTTPVAVSAFATEILERRQITSVNDLQRVAPGLSAGGTVAQSSQSVYLSIRGQSQSTASQVTDTPVGVYINGIYHARSVAGNAAFVDIGSVEVLRGPQGTLFGRNTTGGALNITTHQPTDRFEGYLKAGYGNYNQKEFEGVANLPFSDQLSSRFVFRYGDRDGYGYNSLMDRKFGAIDHDIYTRASLKWSPDSLPVTLALVGDYAEYRDNGTINVIKALRSDGVIAGIFDAFGIDPESYLAKNNGFYNGFGISKTGNPRVDDPHFESRAGGVSANLDIDLGGAHIKSITGFRASNNNNSMSLDATPFAAFAPVNILPFLAQYSQQQVSEELQISGTSGPVDWVFGGIYFREYGRAITDSYVFSPAITRNANTYSARSVGFFGQGIWHVTDALRLTGGIRYTWDKRFLGRNDYTDLGAGICQSGPDAGATGDCRENLHAKFSYPAWLASIDYEISDGIFTYLKTSGASLSGGFNVFTTPPGFENFGPEHVKDVELGFKADFLDHKVRTNIAAFYTQRKGAQNPVNTYNPVNNTLTEYVTNAGTVLAKGIEFEGTVLPWHGMELTTALSYLHSRYKKGSFLIPGLGGIFDRSGEKVQRAPKWTANVGGTQTFDLAFGKAAVHLDYAYVSSQIFYQNTPDPTDPTQIPADFAIQNSLGRISGYGILNGRVTVNLDNPNVEIAVWAQNLANKHYYRGMYNAYVALGETIYSPGTPRLYGATISYRW